MTKILVYDDNYETIHAGEADDEEFYDILMALIDAYKGGESYIKAIHNVVGDEVVEEEERKEGMK